MHRRIPGSMRTRHEFSDLIEGRLSSAGARGQLVELATRLIIEEAPQAAGMTEPFRSRHRMRHPTSHGFEE